MNILYPYSWIKEFLKIDLDEKEFAQEMSLCSSSVEKIIQATDKDKIFDVEITSNRPDLIGIRGFAREAFVVTKKFGHNPTLKITNGEEIKLNSNEKVALEINLDKNLCAKFCAIVLDNIKISNSPELIKNRLEKCGVRSLNNIVDITNYIMLEFGQPMHAFDFDKIGKNNNGEAIMNLRASRDKETITTLDGQKRILPAGAIVIEDNKSIYDLAGIMGGKSSEIDNNTKRIILFSQIYDKTAIRKANMQLNHRTMAAQIFERGVDYKGALPALFKAMDLCQKYANASVISKIYDIDNVSQPIKTITTKLEKLSIYLGEKIDPENILKVLNDLQIKSTLKDNQTIVSTIPSFRYEDLNCEEDIIEEYARIKGYFSLFPKLPKSNLKISYLDKKFEIEQNLRNILVSCGYTEVYTYSLVPTIQNDNQPYLKIKNPLTEDKRYLRNESLLPSLQEVINSNKGRFDEIKIFEIANIYNPQEEMHLAISSYNSKADQKDTFRKVKGVAEEILKSLSNPNKAEISNLQETFSFEISLKEIKLEPTKYRSFDDTIPIKEMVSFIDSRGLSYENIEEFFKGIKLPHNIKFAFELSDTFQDDKLKQENKTSCTFSIFYTKDNCQLSNEDIKESRGLIISKLEKDLEVVVRR